MLHRHVGQGLAQLGYVLLNEPLIMTHRKLPNISDVSPLLLADLADFHVLTCLMKLLQAMPYSLAQAGPKGIHGVGNYVLQARSADKYVAFEITLCSEANLYYRSMTPLLTIYCLDSGDYYSGKFDIFGFTIPTGYDYLRKASVCSGLN